MKDSKTLKEEIVALQAQLTVAIQQESFTLICEAEYGKVPEYKDAIGFFDITKLKRILRGLHDGKACLVEHSLYGRYRVYMNPQRNRIFVCGLQKDSFKTDRTIKKINEENVVNFMLKHPCDWYTIEPDYAIKLWPNITL